MCVVYVIIITVATIYRMCVLLNLNNIPFTVDDRVPVARRRVLHLNHVGNLKTTMYLSISITGKLCINYSY